MKRFTHVFMEYYIIIAGIFIIFIPSGRVLCLRCAPTLSWLVGLVAIVTGVAALATDRAASGQVAR